MGGHSDEALAGSLSGITVRAITQPLDVLKIRFQLQVEKISSTNGGYYQSMYQALHRISREEGLVGLWKGHVPGQLLSVVFVSSEFYFFHKFSELSLHYLHSLSSISTDLVCGSGAGLVSSVICQPLDVFRTRLAGQGSKKVYRGIFHGVGCIFREEGLLAFWRGLVPAFLLIVPQTALSFGIYEGVKRALKPGKSSTSDSHDLGPWLSFPTPLVGALAGCISKSAVYPLDVVKKRFQIVGFEEARRPFGKLPNVKTATPYNFKTGFVLIQLWHTEGFLGLFKGWRPSMLKAGVSTGATFTFFELYKALISEVVLRK
uniref:Mitochondrial thiamine pyrophosphate carrier n=1 Tax=Schistocephalus solidus TaxID=70667 RepID=A0A0X3PMZ3_SCHSO